MWFRLINILVYRWGYYSFKIIYKVFFRMRVTGWRNVPRTGACILAANHASFLDPPIVGTAAVRALHYFTRSSLMHHPLANALFHLWNCIPVDRDHPSPGTLKKAIQILKEGHALVLFPEGTRSIDGTLQSGKMGIGFIAHKSQAPIVPVYIDGAFDILPKKARWPRFRKLRVSIGPPVVLNDLYARKGCEAAYQAISDRVMDLLRDLGAH